MNRLVVGAGYGLKDWLAQRVTGVVMAAFTLIMFAAALGGAMSSREAWQAFMANGLIRFLSFLFIVSLCWHAWSACATSGWTTSIPRRCVCFCT
jgi:succinate dehydrogenase / fumarate reductase membrane anchor subunit